MHKVGIIAAADEWYESEPMPLLGRIAKALGMGKQLHPFYMTDYLVGAATYYFKQTLEELELVPNATLEKTLAKVQDIFLKNGIRIIMRTKGVKKALGSRLRFDKLILCDGIEVMQEIAPNILDIIANTKSLNLKESTVAIVDDDMLQAENAVHRLKNSCRYITIVTKNERKANALAEQMLEDYGMPIEVTDNHRIQADFAIIQSGNTHIARRAIVIDATGKAPKGGQGIIYDWAAVNLAHDLPFELDSMELYQALRRLGVANSASICEVHQSGKVANVFEN